MPSISDPQDVAQLFGVVHEPVNLTVEDGGAKRRRRPSAQADLDLDDDRDPVGRAASLRADSRDPGPEADPEAVGRKILLDQLSGRARSRAELAKKMASKNVPDEVATQLLDRFEEVGLIDDAAFAQEWVTQRQEGKGLARRALAQELRRKGIDDEVARAALDTVETDDEVEAARLLVQRKLRSMHGLDQQVAIRRLVGMLARKGYSSSVSFRVVREELDADLNDPEHQGL